ncbi:MAG: ribosome small subunit-dependent GTPase A, partial [Comamonadaceae bacterium]
LARIERLRNLARERLRLRHQQVDQRALAGARRPQDECRAPVHVREQGGVVRLLRQPQRERQHAVAHVLVRHQPGPGAFERLHQVALVQRDQRGDVFHLGGDQRARQLHLGELGFGGDQHQHLVEVGRERLGADLVLGPSGAGKSTLINLLVPQAKALTGEISQALNSGKHTTTSTTWYWVDDARQTALIDSPGFQEFGLHHVDPMNLATLMPDLRQHIEKCKFYNCSHMHEPGCGVQAAVAPDAPAAGIQPSRYRIYRTLFEELSQPKY